MSTRHTITLAVVAILIALIACQPAPTQTSAATPVPPSATVFPPPSTAVPPRFNTPAPLPPGTPAQPPPLGTPGQPPPLGTPGQPPPFGTPGQPQPPGNQPQARVSVQPITSTYKIAPGTRSVSGWFTTGQGADILLAGIDFNNAGGGLLFNHPGGIASDGTRLILADRNNNRVLIWSKLPDRNVAPDLVLGQTDFSANNPGRTLAKMDWPIAVATDGTRLVVADTYNYRLLIWNTFPTRNGQPADLEIKDEGRGPQGNPKRRVGWPWAVWTNGEKLVMTSTAGATVLIWNTFPTQSNQPADISIALPDKFGTPRTIGSNGKNLIIGDHNAMPGKENVQGNFFWKTFPTRDDQPYDFFMPNAPRPGQARIPPPQGGGARPPGFQEGEILWGPSFTADGKLLAVSNQLHIWNAFPQSENDDPDLSVGFAGGPDPTGIGGYDFGGRQSGDGTGIAVVGGRVYVSLSNGNKIVAFNTLPTRANQNPDFAIGAPDIQTNTLLTNYFITNPVVASNGKNLFVASDFDGKFYVWKNLPDQSGAHPDFVYDLMPPAAQIALHKNTLALAGGRDIFIWKKLPLAGELPDTRLSSRIGNVTIQSTSGIALDDKYFYIADVAANKIYVWEGVPGENSNPKFSVSVDQPERIASDGKYLALTTMNGRRTVAVFSVDQLPNSPRATLVQGLFNLPGGLTVSHGHLFVGDTVNNRVQAWKRVEDALAGKPPDVVLGEKDLNDVTPEIGKDKLFWPASVSFDGSYLWVGEYKFSGRVVRFSVR
jgi:hypothetical protein